MNLETATSTRSSSTSDLEQVRDMALRTGYRQFIRRRNAAGQLVVDTVVPLPVCGLAQAATARRGGRAMPPPRLRRATTRLAEIEQGDRTHRQVVAQDLWSRRLRQWRDGVPADLRAGLRPSDAAMDLAVARLRRRAAAGASR